MKNKNITRIILIAFVGLITSQIFAASPVVNYLDQNYYGFEAGGNGWWIQHPANWSITSEKSASGSYCMKYENSSAATGQLKAHGGSTDLLGSKLSIDAGTYTMKVKVWIDNEAEITGFNTTVKEPWKNIEWNLDGAAKGEWVELMQEITLTAPVVGSNILLVVAPSHGGKGTFFIDDISILGEGVEEIPFVSQIETTREAGLSLEAGVYDMKLKVWIGADATISSFYICIVEPWKAFKWEIDNIAKEQWVELSQQVELETPAENSEFRIQVPNDPEYGGGKGTFYIDDISFKSNTTAVSPITGVFDCKIYPNPTEDVLNILAPEASMVAMYNLSGIMVKSPEKVEASLSIPVADLAMGIYYVQIISSGKIVTEKVLVK